MATNVEADFDGDGIEDVVDNDQLIRTDRDDANSDGVAGVDNLICIPNGDQTDANGDGVTVACDNYIANTNQPQIDTDNYSFGEAYDN